MLRNINIIYLVLIVIIGLAFYMKKSDSQSPDDQKIRFLNLAWQKQSVAANKRIIAEWNERHPDMEVEYIMGVWEGVHDYLITGFETGDLPDVIHYESPYIIDFALRGYLADLSPYLSAEMKEDIVGAAWDMVTRSNGEIVGVPFMMQPMVIFYNKDHFEQAGITVPTSERPWSWDDLRQAAKKLTIDTSGDGRIDRWGSVMGLRRMSGTMVNMALSFGGSFIRKEEGENVIRVGEEEKQLMKIMKDMIYEDETLTRASLGKTPTEAIPGFFKGQYSMILAMGVWARQQMVENAPEGFRWGAFLMPKAKSQTVGTLAQTLSVPKKSTKVAASAKFIEFFLSTKNMGELALGDWLVPTRQSCYEMPAFQSSEAYWDLVVASTSTLAASPWHGVPGFEEWRKRVAIPLFQEYFADRLTLEETCSRLEIESNMVLSRYQGRTEKW